MVSAWNVGELDQMTLPPCHYSWQVYTREPTLNTMATRRLTAARRGPNIAPYTARMRPDLKKRKKRPSFEGPFT
jgi:thymidylate synthase